MAEEGRAATLSAGPMYMLMASNQLFTEVGLSLTLDVSHCLLSEPPREANFLSIYESVMTQCPSGWNPSWVGQEDPEAEGGRLSQASLQLHCGAAAKPP